MMKYKHIIWELILIFSGVFVFRSLWTIMDKTQLFNKAYMHILLLVIGIILSILAVHNLAKIE
jgi:hypothetical protein